MDLWGTGQTRVNINPARPEIRAPRINNCEADCYRGVVAVTVVVALTVARALARATLAISSST